VTLRFLFSFIACIIPGLYGAPTFGGSEEVPLFVTSFPSGHFAGVSAPMPSLAESRRGAVDDVVRQVLGAIGVQYDHHYVDMVSRSVRGRGPERKVNDRLSGVAHGVVLGVEQNIVKSSWCRDASNKWICFILVRYPDTLIVEMRRLSKGAKIVASVISDNGCSVRLKVTEVNNVSVVLSSADVTINRRNRFAKILSFFVWKVPSGSTRNVSLAFDPVRISGCSRGVLLAFDGCEKEVYDYLLGVKFERVAVLKGHDELGRVVSVRVPF
jgi:hypothetical protein